MKHKLFIILCALVLVTGIALDFGMPVEVLKRNPFQAGVQKTFSRSLSVHNPRTEASEEIWADGGYRLTFELDELDKTARGVINCYMMKYIPDNPDMAWKYAKIFTDVTDFYETDDAYFFSGASGDAMINRESTRIHYAVKGSTDPGSIDPISDEEAIDKALEFIGNRLLVLFYEEAQVHFDGEFFRVQFINRISNLKNYAFANEVRMDRLGNVLSVDYNTIQYEKVGGCRVKTMSEAYDELPALPKQETVLLERCQLVYIYEDSIIQPAYYFQGAATDNRSFECFVKAALF